MSNPSSDLSALPPADDQELDGTDCAHPAWWRGNDAGCSTVVRIVNDLLDGKRHVGTYGSAELETLAQRIAAVNSERQSAVQEVARLSSGPYDVIACRGHWHVTAGGTVISTDAGDHLAEEVARAEAARMNALWQSDAEELRRQLSIAHAERDNALELLSRIATMLGEPDTSDLLDAVQSILDFEPVLKLQREEIERLRKRIVTLDSQRDSSTPSLEEPR